ncbi:MAG: hypothetical protein AMXMBFR84_51200 [Candidatus Hydrogenedentota bacterium]
MPKLKLDLFSEDHAEVANDESRPVPPKPMQSARAADVATAVEHQVSQKAAAATPSTSSKFVPVGFDEECLRLLDDAVHQLRREGHWKASKSAIIRALIKLHRDDLGSIYLAA